MPIQLKKFSVLVSTCEKCIEEEVNCILLLSTVYLRSVLLFGKKLNKLGSECTYKIRLSSVKSVLLFHCIENSNISNISDFAIFPSYLMRTGRLNVFKQHSVKLQTRLRTRFKCLKLSRRSRPPNPLPVTIQGFIILKVSPCISFTCNLTT